MKLLILAAGSGTRLGDLTEFIPKSLVEINNKTILERQMNIFQKFQKNNVIVIAGPNKDKFSKFGIKIEYLVIRNKFNLSKKFNRNNFKLFIAFYINKVRLIDNF